MISWWHDKEGDILIALSMLLFGGYAIFLRFFPEVPTLSFLFFFQLVGTIGFFVLAKCQGIPKIDRRAKLLLIGLAVPAILNDLFYFSAFRLTTVANAAIAHQTVSIFLLFLAPLILKERTKRNEWIALAVTLLGLTIVYRSGLSLGSARDVWGITLGHDVHAQLGKAAEAMLAYFLEHEDEAEYLPLTGVKEFLIDLRVRDIPIGLLTGNVEGIGWRKCEKAGIRHLLDFGAFGNEALHRSDLVPIAKERAQRKHPAAEQFIIVGDTPRDIDCAKDAGIMSIGVATGLYTKEQLLAASADAAIVTLENYAEIMHFFESAA